MVLSVFRVLLMGAVCFWAGTSMASSCLTAQEMTELAQDFNQFRDLADKGGYCYDGSDESGLIASLMFLKKTQFANQMDRSPDELFSGRFASDWYGYFKKRIRRVVIEKSCQRGVGAFVYMKNPVMFVCPFLMTSRFSALDRASVMMHEARHIDGYGHITCSRGPRAGMRGACDPRISDGGSYAVTVETYSQAAKYASSLHPAIRAFARAAAVTYAEETFETPARVNRQAELTLLTETGEFVTATIAQRGDLQFQKEGQTPYLGRINMRANQMILFPSDRTQFACAVFAQNQGETGFDPDELVATYNQLSPAERSEWVDIHSSTQWSAVLRTGSIELKCNPTSHQTQSVSVQADGPVGTVYPSGYSRSAASAHFMARSGRIYEYGCDRKKKAFVRATSLGFDQQYTRVLKVGAWTYGLRADGELFLIQGRASRPLSPAGLDRIIEMVPTGRFQFFDADEL